MVAAIWLFSIVHGIFFITVTPLWEGFDEPFHYAYIQSLAESGRIPVHGRTYISKEITASFKELPLSPVVNENLGNRYTDFGRYFELPEAERGRREKALRSIPKSYRLAADMSEDRVLNYEAQHPPLYYLLSAFIYKLFGSCDLPALVFVLRGFSLLIGSATIVTAYMTAKLFHSNPLRILGVPLLVALLPMFYSTVARISNDCLGVALFSLLIYLAMKYIALKYPRSHSIYIGIVLGLGLLTKAYFLTAIPAVAFLYIVSGVRQRSLRQATQHASWTLLFAFLVAGAWYIRNYHLYGTVSGLFVMASADPAPLWGQIKTVFGIPWLSAIHIVFREQLWIGNSSFIGISRIYYQLGYLVFGLAFLGILLFYFSDALEKIPFMRRIYARSGTVSRHAVPLEGSRFGYGGLIAFCLFLFLGMMYQIHQTYLITGHVVTGGWYLYAIVIPELLLILLGLDSLTGGGRGKAGPLALVIGAFAIQFLGYFCKAIPYYTGFRIPRFNPKHLFDVYSPEGFRQVTEHLSLNKPDFVTPLAVGAVITAYFAFLLIIIVLWLISSREKYSRSNA